MLEKQLKRSEALLVAKIGIRRDDSSDRGDTDRNTVHLLPSPYLRARLTAQDEPRRSVAPALFLFRPRNAMATVMHSHSQSVGSANSAPRPSPFSCELPPRPAP